MSMIRERADWCISRQRHWGLPIPVFYCSDCGKPVCTKESIEAVSAMFAQSGSNAWYELDAKDILPDGFVCPHCGGTHFTKETDTLDGWFDSGSSHFSVIENKEGVHWPADLYLEGADQYRGWFQSSLLTAVGSKGEARAPYKTVLTHGWVVDGEGKAMHKSLGNSLMPEDMIKKYGADLVRLWVASSDYRVDVRASDNIFKQLSETYRKIRNTARILMANIGDFNPDTDMVAVADMYDIDKWAISKCNALAAVVRRAYDDYEFHIVYHAVNNFCTIDLSKLYIDITKDRVYTEAKDSAARRSAQTAMYTILSALTRMVAPLIAFTGEEIWQSMPHDSACDRVSVFCNPMPKYDAALEFPELTARYDKLFACRDTVMKALELARAEKVIGKSLDAKADIYVNNENEYALLNSFGEDCLEDIFITSGVNLHKGEAPAGAYVDTETSDTAMIAALISPADGERCDRCWKYSTGCGHTDEGTLCPRCEAIVNGTK